MAFPTGWGYKCSLIIQGNKVVGDVINFPVLITESGLHSDIFIYAEDDGGDLRFSSDTNGQSQLSCEVVSFNTVQKIAEIWVNIPILVSGQDTTFYVWYNKSKEQQPNRSDTYGLENVWDDDYKGIWHLQETISGVEAFKDSTQFINHATDYNNPLIGVSGYIGNCIQLVGNNKHLKAFYDDSLILPSGVTLEAWVNCGSTAHQVIFGKAFAATHVDPWWEWLMFWASPGYLHFRIGSIFASYGDIILNTNVWYHLVLTADGTNWRYYINGDLKYSPFYSNLPINTNSRPVYFGINANNAEDFIGKLDEVRASNIARPAWWIKTEYNNQHDLNTFIIAGTPVSTGQQPRTTSHRIIF